MARQQITERVIETDVLVMGGGIGGCPAAAKAAEHGLNVTLVEKSKLERSGKAGQGLDEIGIFPRDGLTPLEAVRIYLGKSSVYDRGGTERVVNPRVLFKLFDNAMWALEELEKLGVNMKYINGEYGWMPWGFAAGGELGPKVELRVHWQNVKPEMAAGVRKRGINVIERTMVVDLLTHNGKVAGATAVNTRTGEFIVFKAKAVVIASGDLERHYNSPTPHFWKYKMGLNTCPAASSGDGQAVAYRAGAYLSCMEMMRPVTIRDIVLMQPGQLHLNDGIPAKVFTWKGDEISRPPGPLQFMELERQGLAPLYYSLEHLPDDFQKRLEVHIADETMLRLKMSQDRGFNPRTHRYQIVGDRAVRFNNTGIVIGDNLEALRGVYAVGECTDTYGIGAGGTAVAGFVVGENICNYVSGAGEPPLDKAQVEYQRQTALAPLAVKDGVEPLELECTIRNICEEYGGTFKSEGRLREGLKRLGSLKREFLPRLMAPNPHYLMRCLEVRNIMALAELHLQASLERKETRGLYIRLDCPQRDPSLDNRRVYQRMVNGQATIEMVDVPELSPDFVKEKK